MEVAMSMATSETSFDPVLGMPNAARQKRIHILLAVRFATSKASPKMRRDRGATGSDWLCTGSNTQVVIGAARSRRSDG
jgi:hypothetical protein